ncbi:MAG: EscU/YscU/HrcU family type III secretion system export apparatus switch protein [Stappiaceae bacterium]
MSEEQKTPSAGAPSAVALNYDGVGAPRVVAKGNGAIAEQIRALAEEHDVPIEDNPVLVAALSQIELGDEIPETLYQAVAVIIGFILRNRA